MASTQWSDKAALRRLYNVCRVPAPAGQGWGSSASSAGYIGYARDSQVVAQITRAVLLAVCARRPHPQYGDDGIREAAREDALEVLERAEAWFERRQKDDWSFAGAVAELPDLLTVGS